MAEYIIDKIEYGGNVYKLQDSVSDFLTGAVTALSTTEGQHSTITNQNGAVSIAIPTKTSHLTNDSGFITSFTDEKVTNTALTAATTYYLTGSTNSSTETSGLSKHAAIKAYVTANSGTGGSARIDLGNTTATTSAGGKEGVIRLYGTSATYYVELKAGAPSANRTISFPNKAGTVALTSDIPTVSYPVTSVNNKTGAVSLTASDVGALPSTTAIPSKTSDLTNDSGFLTSYTETDPVFGASAAAGITSTDISNWNAKSDFSGSYLDLTNKPTNVSSFTNDSGYITASDITGKADKTATVSTISWDSTNKKITKTINGATSDVVSLIAGDNITLTPSASGLTITSTASGQDAYVSKLESSYTTTTSSTTTVPIGINNFGAYDMLFVDINGLDLIQGTDYTISGQNIVLTTPITTVGTVIHFVAIRMVATSSAEYSELKGDTGDAAGFGTPTATINNSVGTPGVTVTASGPDTAKVFNFAFTNLKGNTGAAAGFGTPTATVNNTVGTPGVTVTASGADTEKVFNFAFTNLKGEKGEQGDPGTHTISYQSTITSGQQAGVLTIDGVSTPIYANVVWG